MDSPPIPDSVKRLALQLVRPKSRAELRRAVDAAVARDVVFAHSLGVFCGRDAYYSALRVVTALFTYERVVFEDVFVSSEEQKEEGGAARGGGDVVVQKAALVMLLSLRPKFLPLVFAPLLDFPTIAVLHFQRHPSSSDGKYLLTHHVDSNSIVALATALSPLRVPWSLAARLVLPALAICGVVLARAIDAACDARDSLCAAAGSWLRPLLLLSD